MKKLLILFISLGISSSAFAYSCGARAYCKNMSSCEEAQYQLNVCGFHKLDRDGDGIPCENVCGKGGSKAKSSKSAKASKASKSKSYSTKTKKSKSTKLGLFKKSKKLRFK